MSKMSAVKLFHSVLLGIGRFFLWGVRWIKRAFYALVFAVAVLAAAVFFSDEIIKYAINNSTKYVDLNAGVEDVDVHLFTQRIVLKNLRIKNPDGFPEKDAFFASKIAFKFDLSERKNPLKRIYVQNAKVCIEGRTGRRIMAKSFLKSNVYVIAREIGRVFDIKLEKIIFGPPPDEKKAAPEKKSFDYAELRKRLGEFEKLDEVRLENITLENGGDAYSFGSVIFNSHVVLASDFRCVVFGVKSGIRSIFCDLTKPEFGFMGLSVRNPEGFKKNSVFSIARFRMTMRDDKTPDGKIVPRMDSVLIDSPILYLEDKQGSMLGAIGMDNNFAGLYNTVNSMTRTNLGNLFQDEFESVPRSQEFKLPEIKWDNINIVNARIVCSKKDAGLLANKISVVKDKIDIDDIRAHIGGLKLQLDGVEFDSGKQLFTAKDFILRNPAGFPEESAFRFRNFLMTTNFSERVLRGNRVMSIDKIEVNKFFVRLDSRSGDIYDLIGNDNNLYAILDSIAATTKAMPVYGELSEKQINENKNKRPYRFIVKSVKFCDGRIFIGPQGDSIKIPFKDVVKSDMGVEEKGLTSQELSTALLKDIIINSIDGAEEKVSEQIGGVILAPVITVLRTIITLF